MSNTSPTVIQWVLDTRPLWPSATKTQDLNSVASRAISLLTPQQKSSVLRYYHVRDAKLALVSALLKRYAISRFCRVPWSSALTTSDPRSKPVFLLPDGSEPLLFNVSHQAGLVVLLAVHNPPDGLAVGVDVVSPLERRDRDLQLLDNEGWASFVDIHADVFGAGEVTTLKCIDPVRSVDGRDDALRRFYALWCLREAYVKMTGDALLASWLGDLEMRGFAPPGETSVPQEVWFKGERVRGVDVRLSKLLEDYMVATAVREGKDGTSVETGDFESLDIQQVLKYGESQTGS